MEQSLQQRDVPVPEGDCLLLKFREVQPEFDKPSSVVRCVVALLYLFKLVCLPAEERNRKV